MAPGLLMGTKAVLCPSNRRCSEWARRYMEYCLCSVNDGLSLTLGLSSVISWSLAEVPQIITNYMEKSTEGLSMSFLVTWLIGDIFNLLGCLLEPATLPTQYYMAILYTVTTTVLTLQAIYYGHIYQWLRSSRRCKGSKLGQSVTAEKGRGSSDYCVKPTNADRWANETDICEGVNIPSSPIPLPVFPQDDHTERDIYYTSARSLSWSHTPSAGSCLSQRISPPVREKNSIKQPLLVKNASTQSVPPSSTKPLLCTTSIMTILGILNLHQSSRDRLNIYENPNQGLVFRVGRKLTQEGGGKMLESSSGIGNLLGWAMAAIYMGGRLPQIWLNMRRGKVEGLNPLMFVFALIGNTTYVASILVSSLDWARIRPNLPWLVDAGGCVLLDSFILVQFIYFHKKTAGGKENTHRIANTD